MGTWSVGLYASDFALDLRSTVGAIARLPFDGDEIVRVLAEDEPAANDQTDSDHTIFWLVVADQLHKRGIASEATARALGIIADGSDLAALRTLGLDESGLRKRTTTLEELRARLIAPPSDKPRKVLSKPQPFVLDVGGVYLYPTSAGHPINPYFASKDRVPTWRHDGWSAACIVERGLAFGYLAWYVPLVREQSVATRPEAVASESPWVLRRAGTCTAAHKRKMEFEDIASVPIDPGALEVRLPDRAGARSAAVSDISIANGLDCLPLDRPENATEIEQRRRLRSRHRVVVASLSELAVRPNGAMA